MITADAAHFGSAERASQMDIALLLQLFLQVRSVRASRVDIAGRMVQVNGAAGAAAAAFRAFFFSEIGG